MTRRSPAPRLPARSEAELQQRQRQGTLRVRSARDYRALVASDGLEQAYGATDVVVAGTAEFSDQAWLQLSLGPSEPPIRLRDVELGGVAAQACGAGGDLLLPMGSSPAAPHRRGGAQVLADLLAGRRLSLRASGEATALQPRRELHSDLDLNAIGGGRLVLQRGVVENGLVAVSTAAGVLRSPFGPLLGPLGNALVSCSGADSIGLAMPGLSLLGPGSPLLVAGAVGWVLGSGSAHQPQPRRLASGHACTPGAVAAVAADLHALDPRWLRACFFEGHGSALLVGVAAPIPLLDATVALQASIGDEALEAPVLDLSVPRRIKPSLGVVSYGQLHTGFLELEGRRLPAAPAHSPRLAASIAAELISRLEQDRFPLRLPPLPLSQRPTLLPLEG
ncbi:MAG: homocysteine biosynthesis protein [Synechococcaceae cyanobacterium]|nr:homocysteine biosynthesis protein [Synechococcaceae cyanobacterium]